MGRLRSLGYSVAVATAVFVYLALPTLRDLYGPEVMLVVYAVLAVLAGGLTYEGSRLLSAWAGDDRPERPGPAIDSPSKSDDERATGSPDPEIDRELETIRDDE